MKRMTYNIGIKGGEILDLGSRLKERRLALGLTLEEVGEKVGVSKSTVMKWETGYIENMKRDKIALLAKALNVSPLYVMGLDFLDEENNPKKSAGNQIPLLGTIAAGTPILAEENIEDYFNIDSKIKADFALKIKGDSMIGAAIFPDDIVFIKKQDNLENGEIGAVLIDGNATLKKFYKKDNTIILQAENDMYNPIILTNGNVKILGKLVAVLNIRE